jgi:hypothetical protein
VGAGAGPDRRERQGLVVGPGQDDDLRVGQLRADHPRHGKAVHPGQRQVDHHEIRPQSASQHDGGATILSLGDDVELGLGSQQRAQAVAHDRLGACEQEARAPACADGPRPRYSGQLTADGIVTVGIGV